MIFWLITAPSLCFLVHWDGGDSMRQSRWLLVSASALGALAGWRATAQETTTYSYDPLGRLVTSARSGGPNNGVAMATCFDPAGNRTQYTVTTNGVSACGSPTPTPTPTSSNQPPNAVADTLSLPCGTSGPVNLTANDTDPEGNLPLVVQSITFVSGKPASATIASNSTVNVTTTTKGVSVFSYVVADSLGATATGQLTVTGTGTALQCAQ